MDEAELRRWIGALREVSEPVIAGDDAGRPFADEMGHRRLVDGPFLAWCGRTGAAPSAGAPGAEGPGARRQLDVVLWESVVAAHGEGGRARSFFEDLVPGGDGALTDLQDSAGIEVWSETELGALHALSWLALLSGARGAAERALCAARWHVGNLQPDNATGHPWALHAFLWLERESPGAGGREYAATQLSNCQWVLGRPDLFSAYVLRDCGRWLEDRRAFGHRGDG